MTTKSNDLEVRLKKKLERWPYEVAQKCWLCVY